VNSLARREPRVVGSEVAMSKYRCLAQTKGSGTCGDERKGENFQCAKTFLLFAGFM
jgi:hypothetical protein